MNPELKAMLSLTFDLLTLGQEAVAKTNIFSMLPAIYNVVTDVPGVVQNLPDLQAELASLSNPANSDDLAAFIQQKVAASGTSVKVQNIMACSLKLIQDSVTDITGLIAAIKS